MANKKTDDKELESILSEINGTLKADRQSGYSKKAIEESLDSQLHFSKTAKIIEDSVYNDEGYSERKHIAVADAEKVIDENEMEQEEPKIAHKSREQERKKVKAELKKEAGTVLAKTGETQLKEKKRPTKKQTLAAILGVFFTFFIVVGIIATVVKGVEIVGDIVNSTSVKNELIRVIYPLVIIDTPEFDDPQKLDSSAIISSSIWSFIISDDDKSIYRRDDLGAIYVPDVDIETYVRRLYGNDVEIVHQSISDANVSMAYSSESKTYIIDSSPRFLPYTPRIDSITREGDIYTLKVSYILPSVMWNIAPAEGYQEADKVMEYKLKRNEDKSYQMLAVKFLEIVNTAVGEPVTSYEPEDYQDGFIVDDSLVDEEGVVNEDDGASSDGSSSDGASGDETSSDGTSSDETSSDGTSSDETSSDGTSSDETSSDEE